MASKQALAASDLTTEVPFFACFARLLQESLLGGKTVVIATLRPSVDAQVRHTTGCQPFKRKLSSSFKSYIVWRVFDILRRSSRQRSAVICCCCLRPHNRNSPTLHPTGWSSISTPAKFSGKVCEMPIPRLLDFVCCSGGKHQHP